MFRNANGSSRICKKCIRLKDANSEEFDLNVKKSIDTYNGRTKRNRQKRWNNETWSYPCVLKEGTLASKVYGKTEITERHRHRFEYNNDIKKNGKSRFNMFRNITRWKLVEIVEIPEHPYFIAGQFHPELKSRPNRPAPLFVGLIKAGKENM